MKKEIALFTALILLAVCMACSVNAEDAKPIYRLKWVAFPPTAPIDMKMVEDELNKMSREKVGVEVEFYFMDDSQVRNSMLAGEIYDMYFSCAWYNNYNQAVSSGFYADITDKVKEWTPKLYATLDEKFWNLAKSADGRLYGIPTKKDFAPMLYISYDAKFAREHGFNIPDEISSWDEMTDYLKALKASMEPGDYPVMIGGSPGGMETSFDFIDRTALIGVDFGDTKVKTVLENKDILDRIHTMYKWRQMGLVNPDAATIKETSIDNHHHHIKFNQSWPGQDLSPIYGYETAKTKYAGPMLTTDGMQGAMTAFSVTLENDPERFRAAMKYQEMVNTDVLYRDTLRYGIQGYHWNYADVPQDDGTVGKAVVRTEVGKSNYITAEFAHGSVALLTVEASPEMLDGTFAKPNLKQWDEYFELIKDTPVSAIAGFTFKTDGLTNILTELQVIKEEYHNRILSGTDDPDVAIPAMLEKMNSAGLQTVIDEAQRQLDEYLSKVK